MPYQPTPWVSGDVITSRKLTKIEEGIAEVEQAMQKAKASANDLAGAIKSLDMLRQSVESWDASFDEKADVAALEAVEKTADAAMDRVKMKADAGDFASLALEAERIRQDLTRLADVVRTRAAANDVGAVAALADHTAGRVDELSEAVAGMADESELAYVAELTEKMKEQVATKAGAADLAGVALMADELRLELLALADKVTTKAEAVDLGYTAIAIEEIIGRCDELSTKLGQKADTVEVMGIAAAEEEREKEVRRDMAMLAFGLEAGAAIAETENLRADTREALRITAKTNEIADVHAEMDALRITQENHSSSILSLMSSDATMAGQIAGRVQKPSGGSDGTSGQVLSTNGDGTTAWVNPFSPSGEQIGEAVADWLSDHPEATTTVEDGSITREKLSGDVNDALDDAANGGDAETLAAALTISGQMERRTDSRERYAVTLAGQYRTKLFTYANYFKDNGLGFILFTDPHSISSRVYGTQEDQMLQRLRDIRVIYENTPARYVLCGGDWLNMYHTADESAGLVGRVPNLLRSEIGERCYTVCGNHDTATERPAVAGQYLSQRDLARLWFDSDVGYYAIEGEDHTVFMFDSGPTELTSQYQQMNDYDLAQGRWLATKLISNTKPHLMGVIHVLARDTENGWFATVVTGMLNAFNRKTTYTLNGYTYNFAGTTGTFHFMMAGHFHNDDVYTRNSIPVIYTTHCVNRLLVDCCYADFDHAVLRMERIGNDGSSRTVPIIPTGGSTAGT